MQFNAGVSYIYADETYHGYESENTLDAARITGVRHSVLRLLRLVVHQDGVTSVHRPSFILSSSVVVFHGELAEIDAKMGNRRKSET